MVLDVILMSLGVLVLVLLSMALIYVILILSLVRAIIKGFMAFFADFRRRFNKKGGGE